MDTAIQEGQQLLEAKRELLKLTESEPTFLTETGEICPTCGDKLYIGINDLPYCDNCAKNEVEKSRQEAREDIERMIANKPIRELNSKIGACNIGDRFKGMTFDDYKPTCDRASNVLSNCRKYVQNFQTGSGASLLMLGSPGTGKNMLSAIIGQDVIRAGHSFFHTTALKLVRRIKDSWKNKEEAEQDVIDSFVVPSLLVIDEIGVQFGSATEQLFLTEVINERYEKKRPTILISNLKLSQLTEVMGGRVIDRFFDDGSKILVFDWDSYRRRNQ